MMFVPDGISNLFDRQLAGSQQVGRLLQPVFADQIADMQAGLCLNKRCRWAGLR